MSIVKCGLFIVAEFIWRRGDKKKDELHGLQGEMHLERGSIRENQEVFQRADTRSRNRVFGGEGRLNGSESSNLAGLVPTTFQLDGSRCVCFSTR